MQKAQAQMVSVALYSAIIVVGISTVIVVSDPILDDMRDAESVEAAQDMLTGLEGEIRTVAEADAGSMTEIGLQFARGTFIFDADDDAIRYELETDADIISPHTMEEIGNLQMSSATDITVEHDTVDNTPCWRMENDHVSVCIRDIPRNATDQIGENTVGYWRFNENRGSTATDISGNGNDGDIAGAQWVDGVAESALTFDGESDHVNAGADTSLRNEAYTVTAWVRFDELSGTQAITSKYEPGSRLNALLVEDDRTFLNYHNGSWQEHTGDIPLSSDRWHHIAVTVSPDHARTYVDGEMDLDISDIGTLTENDGDQYIGSANGYWQSDATIDEVRVWDRALAPDEVEWVYRQHGHLDYIDTENLILEYYNRDADEYLEADFGITMRTDQPVAFTHNGTGYVEPETTGSSLGQGAVAAEIQSFFGIDYTVTFKLLSGADFLQVDVDD